jgi:hypothetical protein
MKKISLPIGLAFVALVLASCVSVSANPVPPKASSDDCLVLLRTEIVNKSSLSNVSSTKHYGFRFSDGLPAREVSTMAVDYVPIVVKNAETKIVELYSYVDRSMATGNDDKHALNVALPYKPGEVIVADFEFVVTITEPSTGTLYTGLNFVDVSPVQKDNTLKLFAKDKNAKTWM